MRGATRPHAVAPSVSAGTGIERQAAGGSKRKPENRETRNNVMLFLDGMSRLRITLCGVELQNPVIAASGTYGYGVEFEKVADLNAIGGIVVKGLSREPIRGTPPPRLWESEGGMINYVGLKN